MSKYNTFKKTIKNTSIGALILANFAAGTANAQGLENYLSTPVTGTEISVKPTNDYLASNTPIKVENNTVKYSAPKPVEKGNLFGWSDRTWALVGVVGLGALVYSASRSHHHNSSKTSSQSNGGSSGWGGGQG